MQNCESKPILLVYHRRKKRWREISHEEVGKSHTTGSSHNAVNSKKSKTIIVYRRRRRRITTDTHGVKLEPEGLCVNSNDSPIDFTSITEIQSTKSNKNSCGSESLGPGTDKRRPYDLRSTTVSRVVQEKILSAVSRPVLSQLSTTAEEAKPDVSTTSELTQVVTSKGTHRFQRTKSGLRRPKRYLKYSTILKNTSYGLKDSDVCKEDEDYRGDERKQKIMRTIESLYALPLVSEDFCMKSRYLKYSTNLKDTRYENSNSKITQHRKDLDLYIEDEDYMGDERIQKVTKSIESLYACPIVIVDYNKKSWDYMKV